MQWRHLKQRICRKLVKGPNTQTCASKGDRSCRQVYNSVQQLARVVKAPRQTRAYCGMQQIVRLIWGVNMGSRSFIQASTNIHNLA